MIALVLGIAGPLVTGLPVGLSVLVSMALNLISVSLALTDPMKVCPPPPLISLIGGRSARLHKMLLVLSVACNSNFAPCFITLRDLPVSAFHDAASPFMVIPILIH